MTHYIASFSGGKDSTAMVHKIIENGLPLDEVIFIDTGMEFIEMYDHVDKVHAFIESHGVKFTVIKDDHSFEYYLVERPIIPRSDKYEPHNGYGWPLARTRWCTNRLKLEPVKRYIKSISDDVIEYIGFALDEPNRWKIQANNIYPLVKYRMTEKDCLDYCYSLGYTWGGLYDKFGRVSCWCCPLQRMDSLRILYRDYPDLWDILERWDDQLKDRKNTFRPGYTIASLTEKFKKEGVRK